MSWLSGLADKAETLLNKIDQNAAAVLHEKEGLNLLPSHSNKPLQHDANITHSDLNVASSFPLRGVSLKKGNNRKILGNSDSPKKSKQGHNMRQSSSFAHFTAITEDEPKPLLDVSSSKGSPVSFDIVDESRSSTPSTHSTDIMMNGDTTLSDTNDSNNYVSLENQLLKNEISVVNNEVSHLITKVKSADKIAADSLSKMKQMESKCSQLQKENENLQAKVCELENQISLSGGFLSETSDTETVINSLKIEVQDLQKKITQLELTDLSLSSQRNELENNLTESQNKCTSLDERLERTKSELSSVQTEWKNYKIRANSTLTMKEKLIEELGGNVGGVSDDLINNLNSQITQLKSERDQAIEEATKSQKDSEERDREIEVLESRLNNTERQYSILKDAFRQEKVAKEMAELNANALGKEMKSLQIESANQISSLRSKLRDNQSKENDHLSNQSASTSSMQVSENGDERLRLLTQALVAKQAALESVTADRNALRLQLEKTETKYRSDLIKMKNNQPRIINLNDTDDVKARFPSMMQENPWDSHLSRGAKKVYSTLDSFSVRVGVFLRRNPVARIFIISYMILLHLWVCIVLFSYTPEERSSASYRRP